MTNRLATNQTQAIVWRWEGEAFGNTPAQELAGIPVNLRFPGQYYDADGKVAFVPIAIGIAKAATIFCARYPKACTAALKCARNPIKCAKKTPCGIAFQSAKHFICDVIGGSCEGIKSCLRIRKKQAGNISCLAMRQFELRVCFKRRDFRGGHKNKIQLMEKRIKKCDNKLNCCTLP